MFVVAAATTNKDLIKYHEQFQDVLNIAKFWWAVLREIGWSIIKGFANILDILSAGQKAITKLASFYTSDVFIEFLTKYEFVTWGLGGLGILFLAYKIASDKKSEIDKYLQNMIFAMVFIVALPLLMSQGLRLFNAGVAFETTNNTPSLAIIQNNITDLYTIDKAGWPEKPDKKNNIAKSKDIKYIDIVEVVDTGGFWIDNSPLTEKGKDILSKQLVLINGEKQMAKMTSHWITSDDAYFRYSWHPWFMMFELILYGIVIVFCIMKFGMLSMELGLLQAFFTATAFTDLHDGKRNRTVVMKTRDIFIVMYFMFFIQSVLTQYFSFINSLEINNVVKLIGMAGGAFVCIQGPNFIEQLFGIDAGSGNMAQTFIAMKQGLDGAKQMGSLGVNTAKNAAKGAASMAGTAGRGGLGLGAAAKGALDGFNERRGANSGGKDDGPTPLPGDNPGQSPNGDGSGKDSEQSPLGGNKDGEQTPSNGDKDSEQPPLGGKGGNSDIEPPLGGNDGQEPVGSSDNSPLTPSNGPTDGGNDDSPLSGSEPSQSVGAKDDNDTPPLTNATQNSGSSVEQDASIKGKESSPGAGPQHSRKNDTLGNVVGAKFSSIKQSVVDSPTVRQTRRVYDVTKNTVAGEKAISQRSKREDDN